MPMDSRKYKYTFVFLGVKKALMYYDAYRDRKEIPQNHLGYLMVLASTNSIENWKNNILPAYEYNKLYDRYVWEEEPKVMAELEKKAIDFYLRGYDSKRIWNAPIFRRHDITARQITEWLYGSPQRDGFVPTMTKEVLKEGSFCPFCQHLSGHRQATNSPKLTGSACDCMSRILESRGIK
jgi:hypothetical protein